MAKKAGNTKVEKKEKAPKTAKQLKSIYFFLIFRGKKS